MSALAIKPTSKWSPQEVIDWVFDEGRRIDDTREFVLQLARRMVTCGAPVERLLITMQTLNPEIAATSNLWTGDTDSVQHFEAEHRIRETDRYIGSPMQQLFETEKRA